MKLKIVAMNDRGVFAGVDADGQYAVLSLDDTVDIDLGDVLSHATWDDQDGIWKTARNLTKKEEVRVCMEDWECTRERAFNHLRRIGRPTQIASLDK